VGAVEQTGEQVGGIFAARVFGIVSAHALFFAVALVDTLDLVPDFTGDEWTAVILDAEVAVIEYAEINFVAEECGVAINGFE
jgi:hypothetical protein